MSCGFIRIMDTCDISKLLPLVAKAVKISQELPSANTPAYVYYNDFPQYKAITCGQSRKVLSIVQNVLDVLDARTNVVDMPSSTFLRDKFESIVDANDRLLERLSVSMDLEEDPTRKSGISSDLVLATHHKQSTSLKWLRSKVEDPQRLSQSDGSPDNILTLLSSPNLSRPQSYFSTQPDNSAAPFRPKLTHKPNSIVEFSDSVNYGAENSVEYPHPYQAELDQFASRIPSWEPLSSEFLKQKALDSDYEFIDHLNQLQTAIKEMSTHRAIAVDLEHHNFRSYLGITCLIQITTPAKDYIIDALALRDHIVHLNEVFTNPDIVKVFHGSDQDLMWLQRDFSVYVVNLFDSHLASRALQQGRHSLSYLLQHYVNVQTNKKFQLADWRIRPLPDALVKYARTDTHYLLYIATVMCQELQDRALLPIVLEQSRQLCLKRYEKPVFDPIGYLKLYKQVAGISFTHRQLYALEHLYALRDSIARREDESVHYVLPDHMLKVIAEVLPRESSGLFACCNPIPPLVRKYVHDLHKIVLDARNRPIEELPLTSAPEVAMTKSESQANLRPTVEPLTATGQTQLMAATPHDRSHKNAIHTAFSDPISCDLTPKKPSTLGQTIGVAKRGKHILASAIQNPDEIELSLVLDANRLLLIKLLRLLKCRTVEKESDTKPNQTGTGPVGSVPSNMFHQPHKTPAEPLIKLDLEIPTPSTDVKMVTPTKQVNETMKPEPQTDKVNSTETEAMNALVTVPVCDQSFDPDEVVILREETGKRNKRTRKRGRTATDAANQSTTDAMQSNKAVSSPNVSVPSVIADLSDSTNPVMVSPSSAKKRQCTQSDSSCATSDSLLKSPHGRGRGRGRGRSRRGRK